jgi:hypothetical protein
MSWNQNFQFKKNSPSYANSQILTFKNLFFIIFVYIRLSKKKNPLNYNFKLDPSELNCLHPYVLEKSLNQSEQEIIKNWLYCVKYQK